MTTVAQRSFSGGEISPSLHARVDLAKYITGLATCRNFMIMKHGGAENRPGGDFVCEVKDSSKEVRQIPFIFNSDQTYVLEFGDLYMRPIRSGSQLYDLTLTITGVSNANPGVVTYTGTDPTSGEEVYISGITGAISSYLNGRNFKIANVNAGANTFELQYLNGTNVNTTSMGSYTSGGTAKRVYTITTPYAEADLQDLNFDQSGDVVTITHPSYAPRELTRTGHTTWSLSSIDFDPTITRPTSCSGSAGGAGANTYRYKITAIDSETFEESLAGTGSTSNSITGITKANPAVVTYSGADNFANGDIVYIDGVVGMTEVNDLEFEVANVNTGANTFELKGINSTNYTTYSSAGTVYRCSVVLSSAAAPSSGSPHTLSWTAVTGAKEYNVYKESNGVYGFIGVAGSTSFSDTGLTADTEDNAPTPRKPFSGTDNYPSTSTYFQQRHFFANTNNDPEKVWGSRSANFKNFTTSSPLQDDDAVTFPLAGREVNEVRHMIDLDGFVCFTSGGEWSIQGNSSGLIRPTEPNPKQKSYYGCSSLRPLIVGTTALFVQARGTVVRDLYNDVIEGYKGNDVSIFSTHLFRKYTIRDWAFQQNPNSIVWAVRSDGVLLGLTYVREHQIWAWHRHDFGGNVEQVCVVPEGNEDYLYLVINRTINGSTKRYIERMSTRTIDDIIDANFLDCSLGYDGRNTNASHTMTLSGGTNWTYDETLTLTSSASYFASTDIGNDIQMYIKDSDGNITDTVRCEITAYTSATVVSAKPHKTVPAALRSTATDDWAKAVDELTGLWHLEGEDVSVFADGFVVASPNNSSYEVVTVTNGAVTLDRPYAVIKVGLPYISDIETLDIDTPNGETLADKQKLVTEVTIYVESSRGIWAGPKAPSDDTVDPLENLREHKAKEDDDYGDMVELETGKINLHIKSLWNSDGRVFIRQVDPIPLSVLAVMPSGMLPFRG